VIHCVKLFSATISVNCNSNFAYSNLGLSIAHQKKKKKKKKNWLTNHVEFNFSGAELTLNISFCFRIRLAMYKCVMIQCTPGFSNKDPFSTCVDNFRLSWPLKESVSLCFTYFWFLVTRCTLNCGTMLSLYGTSWSGNAGSSWSKISSCSAPLCVLTLSS
jgi:hypothetical protein